MNQIALLSPQTRSNFRHLYADIFWYGVLAGSTIAFLSVYAARLGASSQQISLLTAGPALVNLLFSMPSGHWMAGKPLEQLSLWSAFWSRLGYLALAPLPWLFLPEQETWVMVVITLVMSLPGTVLAISFNASLAELVPTHWRGEVMSKRNALLALSLVTTSLLCGQLLDRLSFPVNYQVVFALGALGAGMSTYHLGRLKNPHPPAPVTLERGAAPGRSEAGWRPRLVGRLAQLARIMRLELLRGTFGRFMLAYLLFYVFQIFAIPLFPVFMVRSLNLTDGVISLGNALFYGSMLLSSLGLSRMNARFTHRQLLVGSGLTFCLYPLLFALARDAALYWLASLVGGIVWGVINAALINRLMERVPADDRPAHMAWHNLALNLGTLAGSLCGPLVAGWIGLREALFVAAGLRLLAGVLLWIWG